MERRNIDCIKSIPDLAGLNNDQALAAPNISGQVWSARAKLLAWFLRISAGKYLSLIDCGDLCCWFAVHFSHFIRTQRLAILIGTNRVVFDKQISDVHLKKQHAKQKTTWSPIKTRKWTETPRHAFRQYFVRILLHLSNLLSHWILVGFVVCGLCRKKAIVKIDSVWWPVSPSLTLSSKALEANARPVYGYPITFNGPHKNQLIGNRLSNPTSGCKKT